MSKAKAKAVNVHTVVIATRQEPKYFVDKAIKIAGDTERSKCELMQELTAQYGEKLFRKAKDGGLNMKSWGINASDETLQKAASDMGITVSLGIEVATIQRGINATNGANNGLASFQAAFWPDYKEVKAGKAEPKEKEINQEELAAFNAWDEKTKEVTQARIEVLQADTKEKKKEANVKLDKARVVANLAKAEFDAAKLETRKMNDWASFTVELAALAKRFANSSDQATADLAGQIAALMKAV